MRLQAPQFKAIFKFQTTESKFKQKKIRYALQICPDNFIFGTRSAIESTTKEQETNYRELN